MYLSVYLIIVILILQDTQNPHLQSMQYHNLTFCFNVGRVRDVFISSERLFCNNGIIYGRVVLYILLTTGVLRKDGQLLDVGFYLYFHFMGLCPVGLCPGRFRTVEF